MLYFKFKFHLNTEHMLPSYEESEKNQYPFLFVLVQHISPSMRWLKCLDRNTYYPLKK